MTEPLTDWGPSIVAGDFDDDGVADLALGNYDGSTLRILLGDGDGTFTEAAPVDLGPARSRANADAPKSGGSLPATSTATAATTSSPPTASKTGCSR